ncbi:class I SAM-dependent methyltransferase [Brachyspira pulli]|uniref:class I SAM-dependent methyltransferase n=1 Tax=Brachyspira pulli TaxID=310721 RepID=UPI00300425E1
MEDKAYQLYDDLEENNLWFKARIELISDIIIRNVKNYDSLKLLDIGCGSGYFLSEISKYIPNSIGIEKHKYNIEKFNNILELDLFESDLSNYKFDIITFLDVLEHMEYESNFLDKVKLMMNKDATILLTVPAYQWLYGYADELYHHYRRYNSKTLRKLLEENGFEIKKITYFNCILFPLFVLIRTKDKILKKKEVFYGKKGILNHIVYNIFKLEKYMIRLFSLPFGSSVLVVCKLNNTIRGGV